MKTHLIDELKKIPVVDAHTHLRGHDQCQPCEGVTDFILSFYLASLLPSVDPVLAARILDPAREDRQRWRDLGRIWPSVRCTGYGQVVGRVLKAWKVKEDFSAASFEAVRARLRARTPAQSRAAYRRAGITRSVTHFLAHPFYDGSLKTLRDFLKGGCPFDEGFHPLLGSLPFHEFHSRREIESLGQLTGMPVGSLDDLSSAVRALVEQAVRRGAVGLKDHAAYTRGLSFEAPDRTAAAAELRRLLAGERFAEGARKLSDYLFHQLVRATVELDIPMAIHTGYLPGNAHPKTNVRHFIPILEAYPEARFDLYHLNNPWFEDLMRVLKSFPNTWANCCWTHMVDPVATICFLESALGTLSSNRIFGFGGDLGVLPEPVLAHLDLARDNLAEALGAAVRRKWCSSRSALEIARLWLEENPRAFYKLPAVP